MLYCRQRHVSQQHAQDIFGFLLHQWLRERATILCHTHTALLIHSLILETLSFSKVECAIIESQIFLFRIFIYVIFLFGNSLIGVQGIGRPEQWMGYRHVA